MPTISDLFWIGRCFEFVNFDQIKKHMNYLDGEVVGVSNKSQHLPIAKSSRPKEALILVKIPSLNLNFNFKFISV